MWNSSSDVIICDQSHTSYALRSVMLLRMLCVSRKFWMLMLLHGWPSFGQTCFLCETVTNEKAVTSFNCHTCLPVPQSSVRVQWKRFFTLRRRSLLSYCWADVRLQPHPGGRRRSHPPASRGDGARKGSLPGSEFSCLYFRFVSLAGTRLWVHMKVYSP